MTPPPTADMLRVFGRIGLLSFGGPAAQIALMHRELVETRPWLTEQQFLGALSFCMLLPGPEAMQLATYAGWRLRGTMGGLLAGLLFVLPGAAVMLALASFYAAFGSVPLVEALFLGIKATVIVIVLQALLKVSSRALNGSTAVVLAFAAFIAIFVFEVPFPLIILTAALVGALLMQGEAEPAPLTPVSTSATLRTIAIWGALWLAPVALLAVFAAPVLSDVALFFSTLAVVTFGGAYAVLAYMVQEVVGNFGWLTTGQMMDALGLAETTPGPLILVTQFVGFMAGEQAGGWWLGLLAALVTLWVTFVPCFLWIFAGAPYVEWIATRPRLTGALQGITAAVVGVIANLSIWFALNVWFTEVDRNRLGLWVPDATTIDISALFLSGLAAALLLWRKTDLLAALALMGGAGIVASFLSESI
ncbi:chromate efflux transporter [Gymnodinialimonas ceratoperidinii]|uniref:Chromate efflux transporter n=1 Tax=Gymnodinialimonas ceratoperidinii TaxID=2856823 RepID=A0A8F6TUV6_9RHOB|nr:chromate efflux transporter [Gymnodinialimonas ceratoperidinii]QXT39140.1 chromate efflux transporter [Gymnodinialimonas ceratoperidinii]